MPPDAIAFSIPNEEQQYDYNLCLPKDWQLAGVKYSDIQKSLNFDQIGYQAAIIVHLQLAKFYGKSINLSFPAKKVCYEQLKSVVDKFTNDGENIQIVENATTIDLVIN